MKQFFKMFFASFLAIIISGVVLFGLFIASIASLSKAFSREEDGNAKVSEKTVLVMDLEDVIHERGMRNSFASITGDPAYQAGVYDLLKALKHAQTDSKVHGMLIKTSMSPNGQATLEQLREGLAQFRAAGKFVYAYGEVIPQKSYFLASVADSIFLNPAGFPELNGLSTQLAFFKGTLQKLDIEPEIFYAGKFKSATEPFRTDKMSEPNRQQIRALQRGIWDSYLMAISEHTRTDTGTIQQWVRNGSIQFASDAVRVRMVDRLAYWDEVEHTIRKKLGSKEKDEIAYTDVSEYASTVRTIGATGGDRIALLCAEGEIVDGESSEDYQIASSDFIEEVRKIRNNERIKAVVLRVNSPGGSALASDVIWRELQLLKARKPLIVSMGDYAASGGYYISSIADSIFAMPTTITGSIGVFSMFFSLEKMLNNKLGVTMDEEKNAPYAGFPSVAKTLNEGERKRMQSFVDTIYANFKSRVATGRKLSEATVDSIAQGRVWTGRDALTIGLVDGLGNLDRAFAAAAAKAKLKDYKISTYPSPTDRFEMLFKRMSDKNAQSAIVINQLKQELGTDISWMQQFSRLRRIRGKAQMAMPYDVRFE